VGQGFQQGVHAGEETHRQEHRGDAAKSRGLTGGECASCLASRRHSSGRCDRRAWAARRIWSTANVLAHRAQLGNEPFLFGSIERSQRMSLDVIGERPQLRTQPVGAFVR